MLTISKMENNEIKIVCIKNCTCYYFNDTIKFEDIGFDSIPKPLRIRFCKIVGLIRVYG